MKQFITILAVLFAAKIFAQNVGIGNTNPNMKLHVSSRSDTALLMIDNNTILANNTNVGIYLKNGNWFTGALKTTGTGSNVARLGLYTYASGSQNDLVERFSITDNGFTGIGTINPNYLLDVNGRQRLRHNGNTAGIWLNKSDETEGAFIGMINDTAAGFWGNSAAGNWRMGVDLKNARLGVNIANPQATLDVNGNVRISGGNPGAGKVLTSDASGNAQWENIPQRSAFKARLGASYPINTGTNFQFQLNTVEYDLNNNLTDFGFMAPVTGVYHVDVNIRLILTGVASPYTISLLINNVSSTTFANEQIIPANYTGEYSINGSTDIYCFAGQEVRAVITQNSGIFQTLSPFSRFSGHRVN